MASIEDAAECGGESGRAGQRGPGRRHEAAPQHRGGPGLREGAVARDTRANCWELAEEAGHEGPHRMQALLRRYKWSWETLRDALPGLAEQCLPDDPGDLIGPGIAIDETARLKKGTATACVAPQHAGVTGKVENCVTWVFTALVAALGQAWADFDVYMPECWAQDGQRRATAGIPERLKFATKPELAIEQVRRLAAAGIRFWWAAADEVTAGPASSGPRCGRCRSPTSSSSPATAASPSRGTRSSALTRPSATPCSKGGRAGTAPRAPATPTGRSPPPPAPGSSCSSAASPAAGKASTRSTCAGHPTAGPPR